MTNSSPIRKLNKKIIFACLLTSVLLGIPLIIFPMASENKKKENQIEREPIQANIDANDAVALSGTEEFPDNYTNLKGFESELKLEEKNLLSDEEKLLNAFAEIEKVSTEAQVINDHYEGYEHRTHNGDPWLEANKQEQKQQAFDHYDAKRSDILFIDHSKNNKQTTQSECTNDPMLRIMEKSLEIAKNRISDSAPRQQNDIFFMNKTNNSGHLGKIKPALLNMISMGTLIPAVLVSEIDTSLPGPILARVSKNIWDSKIGQTLLIPQNSKLIGEYQSQINHGQTRAQVVWKRIIFPNQRSVDLGAMTGVDSSGTSGTNGTVNNHYDKVVIGLLLTTALNAGVRITQGKYDQNSANLTQELGNSLAQETSRLGNRIADKMLSTLPTIKVPMGKRLNVFVEQDFSLEPYLN
ncbi:MAG: TrbI/VirB10 family protein [Myxococcales bacterium]|nr:TrbI/VirB10 family protein [Myxococcales bacterium]